MRVPPFNTGKVLIGCTYQPTPKPLRLSRTEAMLQTALLKVKPRNQAKPSRPVTERQTDWDGIVIIGGCIAAIVIVYAWLWSSI